MPRIDELADAAETDGGSTVQATRVLNPYVSARGYTMLKVTNLRLALHQICADEHDKRTLTARIMADYGITSQDVMDACDVVRDVVAEHISSNARSMHG